MTTFLDYLALNEVGMRKINETEISQACELINFISNSDGIIWTAGNGGSASTASHAQCDLSKGFFEHSGTRTRSVCLNDLNPLLGAWENDYTHEHAIVNLCKTHVRKGDLLILLSGSGNSLNMIHAANWARENNISVLTITGFDGGKLKNSGTHSIHVPIDDMQVVENIHLLIIHYFLKFHCR